MKDPNQIDDTDNDLFLKMPDGLDDNTLHSARAIFLQPYFSDLKLGDLQKRCASVDRVNAERIEFLKTVKFRKR